MCAFVYLGFVWQTPLCLPIASLSIGTGAPSAGRTEKRLNKLSMCAEGSGGTEAFSHMSVFLQQIAGKREPSWC